MPIPMPWDMLQNIVYTNNNNSTRIIMLHHKEYMHLELNHSKKFSIFLAHVEKKKKKNPAEKYGATSMFSSLGSSLAIDTLFHHIPDITRPNQCPVCKCGPANTTHPLS
jgi:hypothetical protein